MICLLIFSPGTVGAAFGSKKLERHHLLFFATRAAAFLVMCVASLRVTFGMDAQRGLGYGGLGLCDTKKK